MTRRFINVVSMFCLAGASAASAYGVHRAMAPHDEHLSRVSLQAGPSDELLFIFVTSSFCVGARDPEFPKQVAAARNQVELEAARQGLSFGALAVDVDWSVQTGLDFLKKFGDFDEVIVGRNWLNSGVDAFVRASLQRSAVPQILIVRRHLDVAQSDIGVSDRRLLASAVGADGIKSWSEHGAPLDTASARVLHEY